MAHQFTRRGGMFPPGGPSERVPGCPPQEVRCRRNKAAAFPHRLQANRDLCGESVSTHRTTRAPGRRCPNSDKLEAGRRPRRSPRPRTSASTDRWRSGAEQGGTDGRPRMPGVEQQEDLGPEAQLRDGQPWEWPGFGEYHGRRAALGPAGRSLARRRTSPGDGGRRPGAAAGAPDQSAVLHGRHQGPRRLLEGRVPDRIAHLGQPDRPRDRRPAAGLRLRRLPGVPARASPQLHPPLEPARLLVREVWRAPAARGAAPVAAHRARQGARRQAEVRPDRVRPGVLRPTAGAGQGGRRTGHLRVGHAVRRPRRGRPELDRAIRSTGTTTSTASTATRTGTAAGGRRRPSPTSPRRSPRPSGRTSGRWSTR